MTSSGDPSGAGAYAMQVGARLREARRSWEWTLVDAAAASGGDFSAPALSSYERGDRQISVERLAALARLYGIDADKLLRTSESGKRSAGLERALTLDVEAVRRGAAGREVRQWCESILRARESEAAAFLAVRGSDHVVLAAMLGVEVDMVGTTLAELRATVG